MEENKTDLIDCPRIPDGETHKGLADARDRFHAHQQMMLKIGIFPALVKAELDCFLYALKLRSGEHIEFSECSIDQNGLNCRLKGITKFWPNPSDYIFDRGIDVKVADILWVADAPCGS